MCYDGRGVARLPVFFYSEEFMQGVEGGSSHTAEAFGEGEAVEGGAEDGARISVKFGGWVGSPDDRSGLVQ